MTQVQSGSAISKESDECLDSDFGSRPQELAVDRNVLLEERIFDVDSDCSDEKYQQSARLVDSHAQKFLSDVRSKKMQQKEDHARTASRGCCITHVIEDLQAECEVDMGHEVNLEEKTALIRERRSNHFSKKISKLVSYSIEMEYQPFRRDQIKIQ